MSEASKPTSTRLSRWLDEEVAMYQAYLAEIGDPPLHEAAETEMRETLAGTLHGQQLKVADSADHLGDAVLAALKEVSDSARDRSLARWFRERW